ncbi:MAG: FAD binding domain-containing protein [Acidobacteriota bacterium]
MRPARFEYQRPASVAEAIDLLNGGEETRALAGGHSLIPAMNLRLARPRRLVDIGRLDELKGIKVEGNSLSIGAVTTHAEVAASPEVRLHCPALATAAGLVGDPQVRAWGTLGGNLAHADPASDPPTVVLACEGTIHTRGPEGERALPAEEFFVDLFTTRLKPAELVTRVELPGQKGRRSAYLKLAHPASRYAVVGLCVVLQMAGDTCLSARVALGGATPRTRRCRGAEAALSGSKLQDADLEAAADTLQEDLGEEVIGDLFAPADYRRAMASVYLQRAVRSASLPG